VTATGLTNDYEAFGASIMTVKQPLKNGALEIHGAVKLRLIPNEPIHPQGENKIDPLVVDYSMTVNSSGKVASSYRPRIFRGRNRRPYKLMQPTETSERNSPSAIALLRPSLGLIQS
jgi:hypothetical protein